MASVVIGTQIVSLGGQSQGAVVRALIPPVVIGTQIVSLGGQSQAKGGTLGFPAGCDWHSNCIFRWSITGWGLISCAGLRL